MKPYLLHFGIAAAVLLGCSAEENTDASQSAQPGPAAPALTAGVDKEGMDLSVRPQDDFFAYANGGWLDNAEIPADEVGWGGYLTLNKNSLEQSRDLVEELLNSEPAGENERKLADYYRAWMDEELVERLGVSPLADDLAAIAAVDSTDDVVEFLGRMNPDGVTGPFNFFVDQDAEDSTVYVVHFSQSGLGLPDRDYYFDDSERGQALQAAYASYVETLMSLAGIDEPAAAAARVLALETRLAEHQWDKVKNRDDDLTYNRTAHEELLSLLGNFDMAAYMKGIGVPEQPFYNVRQPSYFAAVNDLLAEVDLQSWKDYLNARLLAAFAPYLSSDFVDANFAYSQAVYGRESQTPRWRRAIGSINGQVGELLGERYVERHFSPESKEKMEEMVSYLIDAYGEAISNLDWMGEETREKALLKLSKIETKIGYPDEWKDYTALSVKPDDLVGNIKRARSFNHFDSVNKLGGPIDRDEWFLPPQTVNAYYHPGLNQIVFPAAYLQPPNFIPEAEDAYNYGAIGSTIGHEIGHGFDDQGSKYDGDGNLVSWWTEADRAEFEARTEGLVAQFNGYEVQPGLFVNGELTLGENIGDLGGTAIALRAYRMSLEGKEAPVIDGFTAEERFFLGNAQSSRVKWREQFIELLVKTDVHSPDRFRVNGVVGNMPAFYETYDVNEGDALYIAPERRVSIWQ